MPVRTVMTATANTYVLFLATIYTAVWATNCSVCQRFLSRFRVLASRDVEGDFMAVERALDPCLQCYLRWQSANNCVWDNVRHRGQHSTRDGDGQGCWTKRKAVWHFLACLPWSLAGLLLTDVITNCYVMRAVDQWTKGPPLFHHHAGDTRRTRRAVHAQSLLLRRRPTVISCAHAMSAANQSQPRKQQANKLQCSFQQVRLSIHCFTALRPFFSGLAAALFAHSSCHRAWRRAQFGKDWHGLGNPDLQNFSLHSYTCE